MEGEKVKMIIKNCRFEKLACIKPSNYICVLNTSYNLIDLMYTIRFRFKLQNTRYFLVYRLNQADAVVYVHD